MPFLRFLVTTLHYLTLIYVPFVAMPYFVCYIVHSLFFTSTFLLKYPCSFCHAVYALCHQVSCHSPCFMLPIPQHLIQFVMLYVSYSTMHNSVKHAVLSLFSTASFCLPCIMPPVLQHIILLTMLYVPCFTMPHPVCHNVCSF